MFKFLMPRLDMDGDIGAAAEMPSVEGEGQAPSVEGNAPTPEQTGDNANDGGSFAKRLREHSEKEVRKAQEAWEKETAEKYKDYDLHKDISSWAQEKRGEDAMTLKEKIEYERLQERADRNEATPEMQRRMEALEARAAKADELEQKQAEDAAQREVSEKQAAWEKSYFDGISAFAKDKGIESEALNKFMIDNQLTVNPEDMNKSFEIAMKAMKYDEVQAQAAEAERKGMSKFLQSKGSIPNIKGSNAQAQVTNAPPKTLKDAFNRAMSREF